MKELHWDEPRYGMVQYMILQPGRTLIKIITVIASILVMNITLKFLTILKQGQFSREFLPFITFLSWLI